MSIRITSVYTWVIFLALSGSAMAAENSGHYVDLEHLELVKFIPPPPAKGSAAEAEDLATVLQEQSGRSTAEMIYKRFTIAHYASGLPWKWDTEQLSPSTRTLFENFNEDVTIAAAKAKRQINRPRPFVVSSDVEWAGRGREGGAEKQEAIIGSYPSGHSAKAYAVAFILAAMVPERAPEIFARADRVAWEPVIGGSHFPSDGTIGARTTASVLFYAAFQNPGFVRDFEKARSEVRATLKF